MRLTLAWMEQAERTPQSPGEESAPFFFRSRDAREKQTLFKLGSTGPSSSTGKLLQEVEEGGAVGSSHWSQKWETNSTSEQKAGPRRENLKGLDSTLSKHELFCVSKTPGITLKPETCNCVYIA